MQAACPSPVPPPPVGLQSRGVEDGDLGITPAEAARLVDADEAILIDVVESGAWASLREVPAGSLRIPPPEFRERVDDLPYERTLITYCT